MHVSTANDPSKRIKKDKTNGATLVTQRVKNSFVIHRPETMACIATKSFTHLSLCSHISTQNTSPTLIFTLRS